MNQNTEQIVISGAGAVTSLGWGKTSAIDALAAGKTGLKPSVFRPHLSRALLGLVPIKSDIHGKSRAGRFAYFACREALQTACIETPDLSCRIALCIGSTCWGLAQYEENKSPDAVMGNIVNSVCDDALAAIGRHCKVFSFSNACASSGTALTMAILMLQQNRFDMVIVCGTEALNELKIVGHNSVRTVTGSSIKPFSKFRDGTALGEGAGALVLETASHAIARNHPPLAAVLGWGMSSDAFDLTRPLPDGDGAELAIRIALKDMDKTKIDFICTHGTGTRLNDSSEINALSRVFDNSSKKPHIMALKPFIGHTLGACSVLELAILTLCAADKKWPFRYSPDEPMEMLGFDFCPHEAKCHHHTGLINTLGFGGINTSVAVTFNTNDNAWSIKNHTPSTTSEVVINIQGLSRLNLRQNQIAELKNNSTPPRTPHNQHALLDLAYQRLGFIADSTKYMLLTLSSALDSAALDLRKLQNESEQTGIMVLTLSGAMDLICKYEHQLRTHPKHQPSQRLFIQSNLNTAAAILSCILKTKGPNLTQVGPRSSRLASLAPAVDLLAANRVKRLLLISDTTDWTNSEPSNKSDIWACIMDCDSYGTNNIESAEPLTIKADNESLTVPQLFEQLFDFCKTAETPFLKSAPLIIK